MTDKTKKAADKKPVSKKKPSPTATPERVAAAEAANTAKPVAAELLPPTESQHSLKLEEVAKPEVVEAVAKANKEKAADEKPAAETPDFKKMADEGATVEKFVECYNEMAATAEELGIKKITALKSFIDVNTGRLACERLHLLILKTRDPEAAKEAKMASKKKTKTAKKSTGTRTKLDPAKKIKWVGKGKDNNGNPFRKGLGRFARVEKLRLASGKTVEAALKTVKAGTLSYCVKAKLVTLS